MIRQLIPLATSFGTVFSMWLVGNKDPRGWMVGLANQVIWLTFIIVFAAYGLLPLFCFLVFVYSRNLIRWRREEAAKLLLRP